MTSQLDKTFDPAAIEAKWYAHWEDHGLFRPERPDAQPFTIVNPPPNVTGSLHIGHALDNTLQDVVVRYERLRGKDALWVVGTDHAGIATQMVVERQLEAQQDKRTNYSREDFVAKVWEWKAESGGQITRQLRRLGCSMDWSREQFTMDPHFTKAVLKVFVDLYNDGLIYRDKRLVNWDPKLKTAISDLEVETREVQGHFWHFRYPLADGVTLDNGQDHIVVATTRPETMLADMAVAVHPSDERYKSVIGRFVALPITGRLIRIIEDEHADPELGSGAVKITPGHDFNDFEVGRRAGIATAQMLNMLDTEGRVCQTNALIDGLIPADFIGLDRFDARNAVVAKMDELGLIEAVEDRIIPTPFGDRSGVVIEPWLTDQWYVDAETLAGPAMDAVRSGAIEIVPKSWEKTFFNWMENIQPWCISRQLWWGHRIPAYRGTRVWRNKNGLLSLDATVGSYAFEFVAETPEQAIDIAKRHYQGELGEHTELRITIGSDDDDEASDPHYKGNLATDGAVEIKLRQDQDVLDTWFSSALWPFATLGWPSLRDAASMPRQAQHSAAPQGEREFEKLAHPEEGLSEAPQAHSRRPVSKDADLLARHYPNDLLISGFDILFFWDARMAMQGIHFMGDVPWKRLYLHGLVRAPDGQKMSKSKGNVVDPLGLIDQYGADALRFFMAAMESQGRDIKMDEKRVEGYRNFATKLWNATRFCQANGIGASATLAAPPATSAVNRWIIGEVVETVEALDRALAELRFDAAANTIYHFVWDSFCDWYLELIKGSIDDETKAVAGWVLDQILVMLHPFMPFITEELWHAQGTRPYELILAKWPQPKASVDAEAKAEVEWLIALVGNLRAAKNELGIAPGAKLDAYLPDPSPATRGIVDRNPGAIDRLARLNSIRFEAAPAGAAMQIGAGDATIAIPLEGIIDIEAEKARLAKALEAARKEAKSLEGRLANPAFVERAKPEAVEKARADHAHHAAEAERLAAALARLG